MRKRKCSTSRLWPHGKRGTGPCLASLILVLMLTGCASKQPMQSVDCPQLSAVPATLKESSLPDAQTLSSEAQSWFDEVSTFLSGLR